MSSNDLSIFFFFRTQHNYNKILAQLLVQLTVLLLVSTPLFQHFEPWINAVNLQTVCVGVSENILFAAADK
jgi:hypothetical protein